jgi:hypothetical protein
VAEERWLLIVALVVIVASVESGNYVVERLAVVVARLVVGIEEVMAIELCEIISFSATP